jgi:cytochrome c
MNKVISVAACASLLVAGLSALGATKAGDVAKGKETFEANCAVCHNADNEEKKMGPGLKGLFKRAALANKKKISDASVMEMINKGSDTGMPAFADILADQEKVDVLAYLKTL